MNGEWQMMTYSQYYENVRLAAKGFIKVTTVHECHSKFEIIESRTDVKIHSIKLICLSGLTQ